MSPSNATVSGCGAIATASWSRRQRLRWSGPRRHGPRARPTSAPRSVCRIGEGRLERGPRQGRIAREARVLPDRELAEPEVAGAIDRQRCRGGVPRGDGQPQRLVRLPGEEREPGQADVDLGSGGLCRELVQVAPSKPSIRPSSSSASAMVARALSWVGSARQTVDPRPCERAFEVVERVEDDGLDRSAGRLRRRQPCRVLGERESSLLVPEDHRSGARGRGTAWRASSPRYGRAVRPPGWRTRWRSTARSGRSSPAPARPRHAAARPAHRSIWPSGPHRGPAAARQWNPDSVYEATTKIHAATRTPMARGRCDRRVVLSVKVVIGRVSW